MSRRALAIINGAGLTGDVLMTKHARIEAAAAGFLAADVHHALAVAISMDEQTKVVTVWRIE